MKKLIAVLLAVLALVACFAACEEKQPDEELPPMANDPEVLKIWETTPALDGIPRFRGNGIFEGVEVSEEGSVTLTYFGVEDKDYLSYTNKLKSEGFSLEPDSAIWMAEGLSGYPLFQRGEVRVALVWSLNGVFTISVY